MKSRSVLYIIFSVSFVLTATSLFAQGRGLGAAVGTATQANSRAGVSTPAASVGTNSSVATQTNTSVATQTNTKVQTPPLKGNSEAASRIDGKLDSKSANVAAHIESDPQLNTRVQTLLPKGTTMDQAAAGFKNEGQFLAALHVSNNLNIPFDQLKAKMTGSGSVSLGAAIHQLRPNMDEHQANDEAKRAEKEAKQTSKS